MCTVPTHPGTVPRCAGYQGRCAPARSAGEVNFKELERLTGNLRDIFSRQSLIIKYDAYIKTNFNVSFTLWFIVTRSTHPSTQ
jgi:hypothetical protein